MKNSQKPTANIQVVSNDHLSVCGRNESDVQQAGTGCFPKSEAIGFADRLDVECEKKRNQEGFGLNS